MINYDVEHCPRSDIKEFIEQWHYSKSINGVHSYHCFKLLDGKKIVGAMLYGSLGMANVWKKYGTSPNDVIELRRLCCIDDTPKNTESYFIGDTLRWLKKYTDIKTVVSYADANYGHTGIIYKATNFSLVGTTSKGRLIEWNGRTYHDKTIRTKYKGQLKPYAQAIKDALESGQAKYVSRLPKFIYVYQLRK